MFGFGKMKPLNLTGFTGQKKQTERTGLFLDGKRITMNQAESIKGMAQSPKVSGQTRAHYARMYLRIKRKRI